MATTYHLPLSQWYTDTTSQWTLDYPPCFAYFEFVLAQIVNSHFIRKYLILPLDFPGEKNLPSLQFENYSITTLQSKPFDSVATVVYQRLSVIVTDLTLLFGVILFISTWSTRTEVERKFSSTKMVVVLILIVLNAGLLLVDHIHFQYNGMLIGLYLISIAFLRAGYDLHGAFVFTILLLFKHIFAYMLPAYVIYLLRHNCWVPDTIPDRTKDDGTSGIPVNEKKTTSRTKGLGNITDTTDSTVVRGSLVQYSFSPIRFLKLAFVTGGTVVAAFLPIIVSSSDAPLEVVHQVIARLVPTQRGLNHAYWAPNVWALYTTVDKILLRLWLRVRPPGNTFPAASCSSSSGGSFTGGLVEEQSFAILPDIPSHVCLLLCILAMLPVLRDLWSRPNPKLFLHACVYCQCCSFMLGYHVHEKAILVAIVPQALLAVESSLDARLFLLMSTIGHVSLLPLLFKPESFLVKTSLVLTYGILAYLMLDRYARQQQREFRIRAKGLVLSFSEEFYLFGLIIVALYNEGGQQTH
eukprot:g901.t1